MTCGPQRVGKVFRSRLHQHMVEPVCFGRPLEGLGGFLLPNQAE